MSLMTFYHTCHMCASSMYLVCCFDGYALLAINCTFRFARYYTDGEVQKRILVKAYGILFKIEIHGTVSCRLYMRLEARLSTVLKCKAT